MNDELELELEVVDLGDAKVETREAPGFERPDEVYVIGKDLLD